MNRSCLIAAIPEKLHRFIKDLCTIKRFWSCHRFFISLQGSIRYFRSISQVFLGDEKLSLLRQSEWVVTDGNRACPISISHHPLWRSAGGTETGETEPSTQLSLPSTSSQRLQSVTNFTVECLTFLVPPATLLSVNMTLSLQRGGKENRNDCLLQG